MENVRVLRLDDGQCILFNSVDRRLTSRCPSEVGAVVDQVQTAGLDLGTALARIGLSGELAARAQAACAFVAGNPTPATGTEIPIQHFHNVLVLCPSNMCNLGCIYCSGGVTSDPDARMSPELADDAVDYYFSHVGRYPVYTLQFHGAGEPMVNFEVVRRSVERAKTYTDRLGARLFCRLSTNAVYGRDKAEWVAANMHHISLSLDGPADIHDLHRPTKGGRGTYDTVLQNMRIFQNAGILKRMNVVVSPHSLERMIEVVHHLGKLGGIGEIRLLPMAYCGRCETLGLDRLDTERFDALFDRAVATAASYGMKVITIHQEIDYFTQHYCGACGFNMVVAPNGKISTCVEVLSDINPGAEELLIGMWSREDRRIAIDLKKVAALRGRTAALDDECKQCTYRTNCAGNCLVRAARNTGTVMAADPEACGMTRSVLGRLLADMADGTLTDNLMYRVEDVR